MVEPQRFIFNFMKHGLVYQLLHNIDKAGVDDFLIHLLSPGMPNSGLSTEA